MVRTDQVRLYDIWMRLVGIPLITLVAVIIYHEGNVSWGVDIFTEIIHSVIAIVLIWEINRQVIIRSRKLYPGLENTRRRIFFLLSRGFLITILIRFGIAYLYSTTRFWGYTFTPERYVYNILVGLLVLLPLLAIYEGVYLYREWWKTHFEAERLKKEQLQTQLDQLKSQIQPHFLFNSLSTLSSLVSEAPQKAERFIEELSSVYRYLLQTNEQSLTSLREELRFMKAYLHLLQTRFEEGIVLEMSVDDNLLDYLVPPLTLQLLVENAVKHNVILPDKPLRIRIYTDEAKNLFVVNSLQKKKSAGVSSRTGLKNIQEKYRLMGHPEVLVRETDEVFQVMIPLIGPLYVS